MFAWVVDCKGSGDKLAVKHLANLFRDNGVTKMVYKTDEENALKSYVDDASVARRPITHGASKAAKGQLKADSLKEAIRPPQLHKN